MFIVWVRGMKSEVGALLATQMGRKVTYQDLVGQRGRRVVKLRDPLAEWGANTGMEVTYGAL